MSETTTETRIDFQLQPEGRRWTWVVQIVRHGFVCMDALGRDTYRGSARTEEKAHRKMLAAIEKARALVEKERLDAQRTLSGQIDLVPAAPQEEEHDG